MSIWTFFACDSCPSGPLSRRYSPVTCHPLNVCLLSSLSVSLQAHQLDATKHYVRLKFLIENQVQFYIPKPEEDIYDLVGLELNSPSHPLVRCSLITFILLGHHTSSKHVFSSALLLFFMCNTKGDVLLIPFPITSPFDLKTLWNYLMLLKLHPSALHPSSFNFCSASSFIMFSVSRSGTVHQTGT